MPNQKRSRASGAPSQAAPKELPAQRPQQSGRGESKPRPGATPTESTNDESLLPRLKLRVLVLEDNLQDRKLIRSQLEADNIECEMIFTVGRRDFSDALEHGEFDLVLSDYSLPQFDGLSALHMVRKRNADVPFILITGTLGEEEAVKCLKLGATDCILKDRLTRLGLAVRRAWHEGEARARQRRTDEALRALSGRLLRLQDEERRRIARELHDSLAQNILALGLSLNFAQRLVPATEDELGSLVAQCVDLADETAKALRAVSYSLHPPTLDSIGLPGALSDYVTSFSRRTGIKVELNVAKKFGRTSVEIETALYRIVQESLTNIHRHSGSASARVGLRRRKLEIVLEIEDAGRGLHPETLRSPATPASIGVGIAGMRERLQSLQGVLEIESSSSGTRVRVVVPNRVTP